MSRARLRPAPPVSETIRPPLGLEQRAAGEDRPGMAGTGRVGIVEHRPATPYKLSCMASYGEGRGAPRMLVRLPKRGESPPDAG